LSEGSEGVCNGGLVAGCVQTRDGIVFNLLSNLSRHAEVADAAYAHLIDKDVFKFQVGMYKAHLFVEISDATNDLTKHGTGAVKWESGTTVAFEDVIEGTGGTEKHEEKVGVGGLDEVEKREDVFVRKRLPYCGFVFQAIVRL
jgi:hypothetical protein